MNQAAGPLLEVSRRAELIPYIPFDRASDVPFYVQVYNGYLAAIASGRLRPGQRLPSTRALAADLKISRMPVLNAFDHLLQEGYLEGRVGSGTYVRGQRIRTVITARHGPDHDKAVLPRTTTPSCHPVGPFSTIPAFDGFPHQTWTRLIRRHSGEPSPDLFASGDAAGYPRLREAVADYVRTARGVVCDADQVLIVSGSQMGLRLSALALATRRSRICMEDPSRPSARAALEVAGMQPIAVALDGEGIDIAALERLPRETNLVYVTPAHQDPLGVAMSSVRRRSLLRWADDREGWILEGDYASDFRYSSRTDGALQGADPTGRVIHLGTFSNVLFPGIRLGYVVVPKGLIRTFISARESLDGYSPTLYQQVLTDFIREGHFARHVRRMQHLYGLRRQALLRALHEVGGDVFTTGGADAGLHVVAFLPESIDDTEVVGRAQRQGLFPQALSTCYSTGRARSGLILGFGGSDESALASSVQTLAEVVRSLRH